VTKTEPHLVVLAAQQLHTAATLLNMAQVLQRKGAPLAYGGRIFNLLPDLRRRVPGHFLGSSIDAAAQTAETLLAVPRPLPPSEAIPGTYLAARDHLSERQASIEAQLDQILNGAGIAPAHLSIASRELALNISAALALGDIDFVGTDINWVNGLLSNHQMPTELLDHYLRAYYTAAKMQMDERGQPIFDWLSGLVEEPVTLNGKGDT
jgi:hypothetical protein